MRLHYLLLLCLAFAACSNKDGKDVTSATTPDDSIVATSTPAEGLSPVAFKDFKGKCPEKFTIGEV